MNWYLEVLKKYFVFDGRARRKEYWFFALFNFLILVGLGIVDNVLGTVVGENRVGIFQTVYWLGVLIPYLAVTVRRLHDTSRSGWWILIGIIPCIGWLIMLYFKVQESTPGSNEYGPNPIQMRD